jgi:hypothetical protein
MDDTAAALAWRAAQESVPAIVERLPNRAELEQRAATLRALLERAGIPAAPRPTAS